MPRISALLLAVILLVWSAAPAAGQEDPTAEPEPAVVELTAPYGGQAVQGALPIEGTTGVPGFLQMEIAFRYHRSPVETWFLIAESTVPVQAGLLTLWDTTTLTDGVYDLRLRVKLLDGSVQESLVFGVRVRNYTPVETNTPAPPTRTPSAAEITPGPATATALPTLTPSPSSIPPSATPFGPNPAQFTPADQVEALQQGALAAAGLFALLGLYSMVHYIRRRE
jgi:hypothetical protein